MSIVIPGKSDYERALFLFSSHISEQKPEEEKFCLRLSTPSPCIISPFMNIDLTFDSALDVFRSATANGINITQVSLYKLAFVEQMAGTSAKMAQLCKVIGDTPSITRLSYGWKSPCPTDHPMRHLISILKQSASISSVAVFVNQVSASEATKVNIDFVTLLRTKNYSLCNISLHLYGPEYGANPSVSEEVRHYLNLNFYGRKALMNTSHRASSYKWIEVLATARNDISGLYYFLSANPTLCELAAGSQHEDEQRYCRQDGSPSY